MTYRLAAKKLADGCIGDLGPRAAAAVFGPPPGLEPYPPPKLSPVVPPELRRSRGAASDGPFRIPIGDGVANRLDCGESKNALAPLCLVCGQPIVRGQHIWWCNECDGDCHLECLLPCPRRIAGTSPSCQGWFCLAHVVAHVCRTPLRAQMRSAELASEASREQRSSGLRPCRGTVEPVSEVQPGLLQADSSPSASGAGPQNVQHVSNWWQSGNCRKFMACGLRA